MEEEDLVKKAKQIAEEKKKNLKKGNSLIL